MTTTRRHPVRSMVAVGLLVLGVGMMARSCAGPTTTLIGAGTYEVGDDIVAGYWAITKPAGTRDDPCTFSVWQGDYRLLSSATTPAGGSGISLRDGQTLIITGNCGTWSKR